VKKLSDKAKAILKDMRALLAEKEAWVQGHYAVDDKGRDVRSLSPKAVCWCLEGAFNKAVIPHHSSEFVALYDEIDPLFPGGYMMGFNDDKKTTHAAVLAKLDELIGENDAS
jgi:hypothetical protein